MVRRVLLGCGIASSLLYLAMNVLVPLQWPGYSMLSRVVSELSAIDAPTRPLWVALAVVYGVLLLAFAVGVWQSAGDSRALRVVAVVLLVDGLIGFAWPPMHLREALAAGQGSLTDTLHLVFTAAWGLLVMLAMGFGAAAFGWRFRMYTIATMAVLIVFGALTGRYGAQLSANQPTPLVGLWERINIGAFVVWIVVFAIGLLRRPTIAAAPRATIDRAAHPA